MAVLLVMVIFTYTSGRIALIEEYEPPARSYAVTSDLTVTALPMYAPTVTNGIGASAVTGTTARLNGEVTDDGNTNPVCIVYWDTVDHTDNASGWSNNSTIGAQPLGTIYEDVAGLAPSTMYFYRWYAYNAEGDDWADTTANFTTAAFINASYPSMPVASITSLNVSILSVSLPWMLSAFSGNPFISPFVCFSFKLLNNELYSLNISFFRFSSSAIKLKSLSLNTIIFLS